MSELRKSFLVLSNDCVYALSLDSEQRLEGLDEDQIASGSNIVVALELLVVSLRELGNSLLHVDANANNTLSVFELNLVKEMLCDRLKSFLGPG